MDVDAPLVAESAFAIAGYRKVRAVSILNRDAALGVVDDVTGDRAAVVTAVDQDAVADIVNIVACNRYVLGPVHYAYAARDRAAPSEGVVGLIRLTEYL